MEKLLQSLRSIIERLEIRQPDFETKEWYLLNNLRRFEKVAESSPSQHELENAERALSRFIVDSLDWDEPLFKEVEDITEQVKKSN